MTATAILQEPAAPAEDAADKPFIHKAVIAKRPVLSGLFLWVFDVLCRFL